MITFVLGYLEQKCVDWLGQVNVRPKVSCPQRRGMSLRGTTGTNSKATAREMDKEKLERLMQYVISPVRAII